MKKICCFLFTVLAAGILAPLTATTLRADNKLPPATRYVGTPGKQATVNNGPARPGISGYSNPVPRAGGKIAGRRIVRRTVIQRRVVIRRLRSRIRVLRSRLRTLRARR
ncbi:MAG TPA: hypothetical protein VHC95_06660 [Opitutales bacterium]|nr:hypothetical protein [Opitutales bacterium]